jgi:L-alanine-DL-glutamate epimerase-like enolase superfamily enzyme
MRISDLEFHLVEVQRTGPLPPVRSLLVRLSSDEGADGWGEGWVSWRPSELRPRRELLLPVLSGRSIFDIEELHTVEALAHPSLRAAVEMACWDLVGKASGQPLCRLWGGQYRRRIPVAVRLNGRSPQRLAWLAREMNLHGFYAQVITTSGEAALDRQILVDVRQSVGDGVQLRIDAQASYTFDTARDLCREIECQQVQCLIDPLANRTLYPIASLARQTTVPLGIWRTVLSPGDLLVMARCDTPVHAVIDPEQLGGISPARACAAIGSAAGISLMLGSRPTLGIATAAMLHLAAATPGLSAANESAYHELSNDVITEPLEMFGGMMTVPEGPGLGVEVDRAKLDRFLVD